MNDFNIRVTHRIELGGGNVSERVIDIETIPDRANPSSTVVAAQSLSIDGESPAFLRAMGLPPTPRFTKVLANGMHGMHGVGGDTGSDHVAVIDNTTGLMWSVESLGDPEDTESGITQEHCIELCRELTLLGFDDWRLPTRAELVGLIDDARHEPAIDAAAFPRVKSRWHWTSTPAAWSSASAWCVGFYYGYVGDFHRNGSGFALAVRRVGQ